MGRIRTKAARSSKVYHKTPLYKKIASVLPLLNMLMLIAVLLKQHGII